MQALILKTLAGSATVAGTEVEAVLVKTNCGPSRPHAATTDLRESSSSENLALPNLKSSPTTELRVAYLQKIQLQDRLFDCFVEVPPDIMSSDKGEYLHHNRTSLWLSAAASYHLWTCSHSFP